MLPTVKLQHELYHYSNQLDTRWLFMLPHGHCNHAAAARSAQTSTTKTQGHNSNISCALQQAKNGECTPAAPE
jgi:hypothetical protein